MPNRVVFLDIDGPVVSDSWLLVNIKASWDRHIPPIPVAILNILCQRSGAKIVFNTTHNIPLPNVDDIEVAMVNHGLLQDHIHSDMKTKFPGRGMTRADGVYEWLSRHPETDDWIGFDDYRYTKKDNLIWTDPQTGLHIGHLNQALERWGCPQFLVM